MGNVGFIVGHKARSAVFRELVNGETDADRIAKKAHLVGPACTNALADLVGEGLVKADGKTHTLTDEGLALADQMKKEIG